MRGCCERTVDVEGDMVWLRTPSRSNSINGGAPEEPSAPPPHSADAASSAASCAAFSSAVGEIPDPDMRWMLHSEARRPCQPGNTPTMPTNQPTHYANQSTHPLCQPVNTPTMPTSQHTHYAYHATHPLCLPVNLHSRHAGAGGGFRSARVTPTRNSPLRKGGTHHPDPGCNRPNPPPRSRLQPPRARP